MEAAAPRSQDHQRRWMELDLLNLEGPIHPSNPLTHLDHAAPHGPGVADDNNFKASYCGRLLYHAPSISNLSATLEAESSG